MLFFTGFVEQKEQTAWLVGFHVGLDKWNVTLWRAENHRTLCLDTLEKLVVTHHSKTMKLLEKGDRGDSIAIKFL